MGRQDGEAAIGIPNNQAPADNTGIQLSQYVFSDAQRNAQAQAVPADKWHTFMTQTEDKLWDGFKNSLNLDSALRNVGAGAVIGAAAKALLPEAGPVGKIAGLAMGAYFVGAPVGESLWMVHKAKDAHDVDRASTLMGNTIGGLPVNLAEGAVGGYIGSKAMGGLLSTEAAQPFMEWKGNQYAKLDAKIGPTLSDASMKYNNFMYEKFGLGRPDFSDARAGIVPPYLLEEMAKRNPNNTDFLKTIEQTRAMSDRTPGFRPRATSDQGGAREVYDAQGEEVHPGVKARFEGEKPTGNPEVDQAYDFTGNVRDFYRDVHQRNSIDGKGMKMSSTVNYGDNFENAFWDGQQMTYGRPGPQSPFKSFIKQDVTGHEITHGVTEFESGEQYRGQPGALNEHNSDVFGELIEQRANGTTADKADWLVGQDMWKDNINGRALRDMRNPGTAYDDPSIGKDPQPAHMKDFVRTTRDNGGVHLNSGIPNKAFADFAVSVGGNAWEAPGHIWYEARARAGETPSFAQFAQATIDAAKSLNHADLVPKLKAAWDGVGVKPSAKATTGPDVIPIVTSNNDNPQPRS